MAIYQRAGLTAQVPIIKQAKNTKAVHIHKNKTTDKTKNITGKKL
jgi:hypothetical protein